MGVAGSGKTTLGTRLAERMGCSFHDGDDYHPQANVEKMSRGEPLNDDDRWPWLDRLRELMAEKLGRGESAVIACSALKERYRERLAAGLPASAVHFAYLRLTPELAAERVQSRATHYMPASLVESQFAALEEPSDDAIPLDASAPVERLVDQVLASIV